MASFCYRCTAELFGEELAGRNDMVSEIEDGHVAYDLCEHCGPGYFDNRGWRTPHDSTCIHGGDRNLCRMVALKGYPSHLAMVRELNFHGVGEFIALYEKGDMSSCMISEYVPTCNTWENLERMLTP